MSFHYSTAAETIKITENSVMSTGNRILRFLGCILFVHRRHAPA